MALSASVNRYLLGWVALGLVGCAGLRWGFRPAFPLFPEGWSVSSTEAEAIAIERLRDLDPAVSECSVVTRLEVDAVLERRLLAALDAASPSQAEALRSGELAGRVLHWKVTAFDPGSPASEWRFRATVSSSGRVWALQRHLRPDSPEVTEASIFPGEARLEAAQFLEDQGFDLSGYTAAVLLRRNRPTRADISVRYQRRGGRRSDDLRSGLEVRYVGGGLEGFGSWIDDSGSADSQDSLALRQVVDLGRTLLVFPLLLAVLIYLLRRRVLWQAVLKRGWRVAAAVATAGAFTILAARNRVVVGWVLGDWTRDQIAWGWAAFMLLLYLPALACLVLAGWGSPHATSDIALKQKFGTLGLLVERRWVDATVGSSCLRGTAAGLFLGGAQIVAVPWLGSIGAFTQVGFLMGPWWLQGAWPGVSLAAFQWVTCTSFWSFTLLFALPPVVRAQGSWVAGTMVALVLALTMGPAVEILPIAVGFPFWLLPGATAAVLFLRYDFLSALLAGVVSFTAVTALPLLFAQDSTLQAQGWIAMGIVLAPMALSIRTVGSGGRDP